MYVTYISQSLITKPLKMKTVGGNGASGLYCVGWLSLMARNKDIKVITAYDERLALKKRKPKRI